MRKKKILGEMKRRKGRNRKWKKSISNWAGVKRILGIYKMATLRFKWDLELWFRYLEFCRERKDGRMKEALAQAIRYHSKVPGLWIHAAAWEFDHNLNVDAARALMQSGLRSCPKSEDLWVEYLRMELTYLNKLSVRKQTLGEDAPTGTDNWKEQNKDSFMALNNERETSLYEDPFWKKGLLMLCVICRGAVEVVRESFEPRKKILEILCTVNMGDTNQLKEEVMVDLRRDFSEECFWDCLRDFKFEIRRIWRDSVETMRSPRQENVLRFMKRPLKTCLQSECSLSMRNSRAIYYVNQDSMDLITVHLYSRFINRQSRPVA